MGLLLLRRRLWPLFGLVAVVVASVAAALVWLLASGTAAARPPQPVSRVDAASRACLLASTDRDPGATRTWLALRRLAGTGASNLVVQRYRLPDKAQGAAYVNTLVQLRCSAIVATGTGARSAVAAALAAGHPKGVRFVVVGGRPVAGAVALSPSSVSARTVARAVTQ